MQYKYETTPLSRLPSRISLENLNNFSEGQIERIYQDIKRIQT